MSIEIGAVKIKDGFFIGDIYAAKDIEFVVLNKITRIVNCVATEIPNIFSSEGVLYMPFDWLEGEEDDYMNDKQQIDQAVDFINSSVDLGESILIHSMRCQNRAVFMCACYLVRQFRWTANTAIGFIYSRKQMPKMKPELEKLVTEYQKQEVPQQQLRSIVWQVEEIRRSMATLTAEEMVLANTFLNTHAEIDPKQPTKRSNTQKLQWNDKVNNHRTSVGFKNRLCTSFIPAFQQLAFNKPILQDVAYFQPILKGSEAKVLKQNLLEIQNIPQNFSQQRASSANTHNLSRTQKMREDSTKKIKLSKISVDKENKQLENEFYEMGSFAKRNTLQLNSSGKVLRKQNNSGLNFHRSSSKDKKLQALLSYSKSKMTTLYSKFGVYGPYRSDKSIKSYNKSMKKVASTKVIRPHSGNNNVVVGPPTNNQVRSFMEGLIRMQQQDFPK